jgi:hypothetical protein
LRYRAFISYCHVDRGWAAWLHRSLERYRVPRRLSGTEGRHGTVPARLSPIFRDREELSSAANLTETIKEALAQSESLVVICSPESARSRWVNEEIRYFQGLGRGDRIYCVIVDGDPLAPDPDQACFPAALVEGGAAEPLAADARRWADGKHLARLKVVAGILGLRLDELRRRDLQRRRRSQAMVGVLVLAVLALMFATYQSYRAEQESRMAREAQQRAAEQMLSDFLEQAERLGDVADLETRKAFDETLSRYLADMRPVDLTMESRRQLGVVLSNRGVILRAEGELEQAMSVFEHAREILSSLAHDPSGDAKVLFELSQVEFWIGQVNLDLGRMHAAEASFKAYAEISDALYRSQPENADWTMEVAYAQSNLGNLESRRIQSDPQKVLQYYLNALEFNEKASRLDPTYERELADSHADVADAFLGVCALGKAIDHRQKNVELARKSFQANPVSNRLKEDYAYSLAGLSRIEHDTGHNPPAIEKIQQSIELQESLVAEDPNNTKKRWNLLTHSSFLADFLEHAGRHQASNDLRLSLKHEMKHYFESEQDIRIDYKIFYGMLLRDLAHQAYHRETPMSARSQMQEAVEWLLQVVRDHPESKSVRNQLALAFFHYWEHDQAAYSVTDAGDWLGRIRNASSLSSCLEREIAARLAVMEGESSLAQSYVDQLLAQGYRKPGFMVFCEEHGLQTGPTVPVSGHSAAEQ